MTEPLDALARRAEREPCFLAWALAGYARAEGLDDAGLAAALGCAAEDLLMLRLCRAPREDAGGYRHDIDRISARFRLDSDRLSAIVKRGRVLTRMQAVDAEEQPGYLMAARDGEADPPEAAS